jgi:hypothetical protein
MAPAYDLRYRLVSDMDWSIRILRSPGLRKRRIARLWVNYELDGRSTRNAKKCWQERIALIREHFGPWTVPLQRMLQIYAEFKARVRSPARP